MVVASTTTNRTQQVRLGRSLSGQDPTTHCCHIVITIDCCTLRCAHSFAVNQRQYSSTTTKSTRVLSGTVTGGTLFTTVCIGGGKT
jgi:hypothetical protein